MKHANQTNLYDGTPFIPKKLNRDKLETWYNYNGEETGQQTFPNNKIDNPRQCAQRRVIIAEIQVKLRQHCRNISDSMLT